MKIFTTLMISNFLLVVSLMSFSGALFAAESEMSIFQAAAQGKIRKLNELLQIVPIDKQDKEGRTPLVHAIMGGQEKVAHLLIKREASVICVDDSGMGPLHYAIQKRFWDIVKKIVRVVSHLEEPRMEECLNAPDRLGFTPLHMLVASGYVPVIRLLIENGACLTYGDQAGETPLHEAVRARAYRVIKLLNGYNNDLKHKKNGLGQTPLDIALRQKKNMDLLICLNALDQINYKNVIARR